MEAGGFDIIMNVMEKVFITPIVRIFTIGWIKAKLLQQEERGLKHFSGRGNIL